MWVTFRKSPYTDERLRGLGLSDRQIKAVRFVEERGSISNTEYRELVGILRGSALRELNMLTDLGVLTKPGAGRAARYILAEK